MYKCKRCGKTAKTTSGLICFRCDTALAQEAGEQVVYSTPPSCCDTMQIKDDDCSGAIHCARSGSDFSSGGGDFGGGGASGDY